MALETSFESLSLEDLPSFSAERKREGWRFVQVLAVKTDDTFDVQYSFMKDGLLASNTISDITKEDVMPSITDNFLAAFVFENEIHDLFGISFKDIAIDFDGNFYRTAQPEPMTVMSPEQKAARDKAKKIAAAKAAKEASAQSEQGASAQDELEAKLAGMDPEKAAKVRAAMEAKAKKEAAAKEKAVEDKMKDLDPEKAAKVKAALEAKQAREAAKEAEKAGE